MDGVVDDSPDPRSGGVARNREVRREQRGEDPEEAPALGEPEHDTRNADRDVLRTQQDRNQAGSHTASF